MTDLAIHTNSRIAQPLERIIDLSVDTYYNPCKTSQWSSVSSPGRRSGL